jgi:hypothetical protein
MKHLMVAALLAAFSGGTFTTDTARPNILNATNGDGLYEKFMRGEKFNTGWVNTTDFEKPPINP